MPNSHHTFKKLIGENYIILTVKLFRNRQSHPSVQAGCNKMKDEWKILDYDRSHILGQGAYATVFKGKLVKKNGDDAQVLDVAIKRIEKLNLNHQNDETMSMERKIMKQKKLNHPNIVKFLHSGEQDEDFM